MAANAAMMSKLRLALPPTMRAGCSSQGEFTALFTTAVLPPKACVCGGVIEAEVDGQDALFIGRSRRCCANADSPFAMKPLPLATDASSELARFLFDCRLLLN